MVLAREALVFLHLIINKILIVLVSFSNSPGFLICLSQYFILKQLLCLCGYVLWRVVSAFLLLVIHRGGLLTHSHRRLILRLSNIDLKATVVICGTIQSTAQLMIMQF